MLQAANETAFTVVTSPGSNIYLIYCNATAGSNADPTHYGVYAGETNWVHIQDSKFSNKKIAIYTLRGRGIVNNLSGSSNAIVYCAGRGGIIHKEVAGSITGTTINNLNNGGLIVNSSGGTIGS